MKTAVAALRGDDALGFLAAIGLAVLADCGELPPLSLGWDGIASPVATLSGDFDSLEELGEHLRTAFVNLQDQDAALPGVTTEFPVPVEAGKTTDPMRMPPEELAQWYQRADDLWRQGDRWLAQWLIAVAGQSALKDPKRRDVELTPFYAPTGRMTLRGSIFDKTMGAVATVGGPVDAFGIWRRSSYDGANFDDRAKRNAAVTTSGEPDNQGAPSPTWLAAMAMRFFPMVDDGRSTRTVGWQRFRMYPGYTYRSLVWPTWKPDLNPAAVRTLLAHPALQLGGTPREPLVTTGSVLGPMGVSAIFGASRRTLKQGDGPLGPARRLWQASGA